MFGMSLSAPAGQPFQGGNPRPARNFLASVRLNKTAFNLAWLHRDARAGYGEQFPLKVRLPSRTNRQCVLAQKDKSVGITSTPLRHSQGAGIAFGFPAELEGGSAQKPPPTCANGRANSIAISKSTAPLLASETRRDHTPHSATIAPLSAAVPENEKAEGWDESQWID
jgi:hypothetical protein